MTISKINSTKQNFGMLMPTPIQVQKVPAIIQNVQGYVKTSLLGKYMPSADCFLKKSDFSPLKKLPFLPKEPIPVDSKIKVVDLKKEEKHWRKFLKKIRKAERNTARKNIDKQNVARKTRLLPANTIVKKEVSEEI